MPQLFSCTSEQFSAHVVCRVHRQIYTHTSIHYAGSNLHKSNESSSSSSGICSITKCKKKNQVSTFCIKKEQKEKKRHWRETCWSDTHTHTHRQTDPEMTEWLPFRLSAAPGVNSPVVYTGWLSGRRQAFDVRCDVPCMHSSDQCKTHCHLAEIHWWPMGLRTIRHRSK